MRLFIALDIDDAIRKRIATFVEGVRGFAPDVRFVGPESFHVTLKFLGDTDKLEAIKNALTEIRGHPIALNFLGYGFFPGPKNARVFWTGISPGPELQALVTAIDGATIPLGFEREKGPYRAHLTLARSGSGRPGKMRGDAPNSKFAGLQYKLAKLPQPEFGTMTAHEFHLYESKLSPRGSQYTKLATFPLSSE